MGICGLTPRGMLRCDYLRDGGSWEPRAMGQRSKIEARAWNTCESLVAGSGLPTFLEDALTSARRTEGSTHNFYLYPARFSPQAAAAVIYAFSHQTNWVLDPFMGGGTTVVEALMAGRRVVGADLNALGHFVAAARTTPLSPSNLLAVRRWAKRAAESGRWHLTRDSLVANLPSTLNSFATKAIHEATELRFNRERTFARCALLRLGQWALDCRDYASPRSEQLAEKLPQLVDQMIAGLGEFVQRCREVGVKKNEITSGRLLLKGDARTTVVKALGRQKGIRPELIFTSPPYPRVHVLYHRWQIRSRSETPAPYWIAGVPDGYYASHYTGGSRTPTGERRYFRMIRDVFSSLRSVISPDATVAQLVGFADAETQLPMYLQAMAEAGYAEELSSHRQRVWRHVPNRKWHARLQGYLDASSEVFLLHHPVRTRR